MHLGTPRRGRTALVGSAPCVRRTSPLEELTVPGSPLAEDSGALCARALPRHVSHLLAGLNLRSFCVANQEA